MEAYVEPVPLLDRFEVLWLSGYTELEKIQIAKRHLIPRQLANHGLLDNEVTFSFVNNREYDIDIVSGTTFVKSTPGSECG